MSFSVSALHNVTRIQKVIPFPYNFNSKRGKFCQNPKYNSRGAKRFRYFIVSLIILGFVFDFSLAISHTFRLKNGKPANFTVLGLSIVSAGGFIALSVLAITLHYLHADFYYSVNSILGLLPESNQVPYKLSGVVDLIVSCFPVVCLPVYYMPMSPNYEDVFNDTHWSIKLAYGMGHGFAASYLVLVFASFNLMGFVLLLKIDQFIQNSAGLDKFRLFHFKLNLAKIITLCLSQCVSKFAGVLIFLGIFISSAALYIVFTMIDELAILIYIAILGIALTGLTCAIFLSNLAGQIAESSDASIRKWKWCLKSASQKKAFATLRPFGLTVMAYGLLRPRLGLAIVEDILNNTVSLIML